MTEGGWVWLEIFVCLLRIVFCAAFLCLDSVLMFVISFVIEYIKYQLGLVQERL